jgi:hypothetical protein
MNFGVCPLNRDNRAWTLSLASVRAEPPKVAHKGTYLVSLFLSICPSYKENKLVQDVR